MSVQSQMQSKKVGWDTPLFQLITVNWEIIAYTTLFVLAVLTRFYDLGTRAMSHDESLHTLYSWNLYAGKGYSHDPLMHGPFLFHITALSYFLFGDNDFTARVSVALFGVVLVVLPYFFRPWLGRWGALAASIGILISPGILFYSRYIRNEAYVMVFTVIMVLAFFQYMRTRHARWLYIGAIGVSLMMASKEVAYIHGFIGLTFIVLAYMWESMALPRRRGIAMLMAGALMLLGIGIAIGTTHTEIFTGDVDQSTLIAESTGLFVKVLGMFIGIGIVWLGVDRIKRPVSTAIDYLFANQLPDLIKASVLAVVIFFVLHTTFFSNVEGVISGTYGAVSYWLAQQEVERGSQPWYYYLLLIPMYEFLPVLIGVIGGLVYTLRAAIVRTVFPSFGDDDVPTQTKTSDQPGPIFASDGGTFVAFLIYWTLLSVGIYSWAGEKMPWLSVHMTLPLVFLAAHVIQTMVTKVNWSEVRQHNGYLLGGALLMLIPVLIALFTAQPSFDSQSLQAINENMQFISAGVLLVGLIIGIGFLARRTGVFMALRVAFLSALLVLSLLTVRFAWLLNYVNYDHVNEFMVYAHGSPDIKLALGQIEDISRRTVGDKQIKVAYDNLSTWPMEWYLREYPNRAYFGENPNRDALDAPIIIVGTGNDNKVKPYLGDNYTGFRYRLVWWPVEDYKGLTMERLWQDFVVGPPAGGEVTPEIRAMQRQTVRDNWRKLSKILFYRHYESYQLNEWPFVSRFMLYVRNDVLNDVWEYQTGPVQLTQTTLNNPIIDRQIELVAANAWGQLGTDEGRLTTPRDVAVAPDGTIYVSDAANHRIQAFDPSGEFLFTWGAEGTGLGQFNEPWGVAVGPEGNVYVADTWNHRIQAFSAEGEFLWTQGTFANTQGSPDQQVGNFWGPRDIAVDAAGNLYVTDTGNKRIQQFSAEGEFLRVWGGGGIIAGAFEEPVGIDVGPDGSIYVADTWNRRVQKFDADFVPVTAWDVPGWEGESVLNKPYLAVDDTGRVFISDPESFRILGYSDTGELLLTFGQYGQDLAAMELPVGLDFDAEGHLLVADSDNNRIMEFEVPRSNEPVSSAE